MAKMLYIISSGEYSDYHIYATLEGENTSDLKTLFNEFRDIYFPGINEMVNALPVKYHGLSGRDIAHIVDEGVKKLVADKLIEQPIWFRAEEGFVQWLVRERGFALVDSDEFNVDIRE